MKRSILWAASVLVALAVGCGSGGADFCKSIHAGASGVSIDHCAAATVEASNVIYNNLGQPTQYGFQVTCSSTGQMATGMWTTVTTECMEVHTRPSMESCGPSALPLETMPAAFAQAYCAKMIECCMQPELARTFAGLDPPVVDQASCVTAVTGSFLQGVAPAVTACRASYDPGKAQACIASWRATSCTSFIRNDVPFNESCRSYVVGKVAIGEACLTDLECSPGSYCQGAIAIPHSGGTCASFPTVGQYCETVCAAGLYCYPDAPGDVQHCQAFRPDGQPCLNSYQCLSGGCSSVDPNVPGTCGPMCLGR